MLCEFLRADALQRLIRPFMRSIVASLPLHGNARLATIALETLGELCLVVGEDIIPYAYPSLHLTTQSYVMSRYASKLMPLILEAMQDQSSGMKREVLI